MTPRPLLRLGLPLTLLAAAVACSSDDSTTVLPDRCNIIIAQVSPNAPALKVGDTLTLHAAYTPGISADCIPSVPAASLRWSSSDALTASIDSVSGFVTARRAGSVSIGVHVPSASANLGGATVQVSAP